MVGQNHFLKKYFKELWRLINRIYFVMLRQIFISQTVEGQENSNNILILRIDGIGDFILFTTVLKYLRSLFPSQKVYLIVASEVKDLAADCPYIDNLIIWNRSRYRWNIFYRLSFLYKLRKIRFDIAINPIFSRDILSDEMICFCEASEKIGIDGNMNNITIQEKKENNKYYTRLIKIVDTYIPEVNNKFLKNLGITVDVASLYPEIWAINDNRNVVSGIFKKRDIKKDSYIVFFPGARSSLRRWAPLNYAVLANRLIKKYDVPILICGGKSDRNLAQQIMCHIKTKYVARVFDITGETNLKELALIFQHALLFIGSETGAAHLALAVKLSSIVIMGGGHFGSFLPYGDKCFLVYNKRSCYECNWICPKKEPECITLIAVDQVYVQAIDILNNNKRFERKSSRGLRIAIDALSFIPNKIGGGETYLINLVKKLLEIDKDNQYIMFVDKNLGNIIPNPRINIVKCKVGRQTVFRFLYQQFILPLKLKKYNIDLLFVPASVSLLFAPCKIIFTMHDLGYLEFRRSFTFGQWLIRKLFLPLALRRADKIVATCNYSRRQMMENNFALDEKIKVIYSGIDLNWSKESFKQIEKTRKKFQIAREYLFYPAAFYFHKNHIRLLEAFSEIKKTWNKPLSLVLTGLKTYGYNFILEKIKELNLTRDVIYLGYISLDDLKAVYSGALAVVFPSLNEGFGFPVLEAMQCACPVIVSTATSLPEIAGNAAVYFNPNDKNCIARGVLKILSDPHLREKNIHLGLEQAKKFSWDKTASKYLELFDSVVYEE